MTARMPMLSVSAAVFDMVALRDEKSLLLTSLRKLGREAVIEAAPQCDCVKTSADEYQLVRSRIVGAPRLSGATVECHVYAVEDVPATLANHVDDSFDAQQVFALRLYQLVEPTRKASGINRPRCPYRCGGDLGVMLVRAVGEQIGVKP